MQCEVVKEVLSITEDIECCSSCHEEEEYTRSAGVSLILNDEEYNVCCKFQLSIKEKHDQNRCEEHRAK